MRSGKVIPRAWSCGMLRQACGLAAACADLFVPRQDPGSPGFIVSPAAASSDSWGRSLPASTSSISRAHAADDRLSTVMPADMAADKRRLRANTVALAGGI